MSDPAANDPVESDPAALSSAEDLDQDELQVDPLEEGIEPPEHWSGADQYGTAPAEQQEGESLEQRVAEERPDFGTSEPSPRAQRTEEAPLRDLDENIDNAPNQSESLVAEEPPEAADAPEEAHWQNADVAGGSVASEIREPERPPE